MIPGVAGVDGGGTHTGIGFAHHNLDSIQTVRVHRSGRIQPGDEIDASQHLRQSIEEARKSLSVENPCEAIVFGLAGAGDHRVAQLTLTALREQFPEIRIRVTTDAAIAFADAFPDHRGILLSAGTGSIAVGSTGEELHRVGGHGWRFGDDGSGYWIGHAAVCAAQKAAEGRGEATTLTEALPMDNKESLIEPRDVALLTAQVCEAAGSGDAVSLRIVDQAADLLANHIMALSVQLGDTLPVAFNGGVLDPQLPIRKRVVDRITHRGFKGPVLDALVDPVRGAVRMAFALAAS